MWNKIDCLKLTLVLPIDLRAPKALPKKGGRRPLVSRKTPEAEGRGFFLSKGLNFFVFYLLSVKYG